MRTSFLEFLGFAFIVTVWGLNYPVSLAGMQYSSPIWLAFFRAFSAFLGFYVIFILMRVRVRLTARQKVIAVAGGIPGSVLFFGLWLLGMQTVAPGISSVLITAYPLWMLLLSIPILGDKPRARKIAAALAGFIGVVLASNVLFQHTQNSLIADAELLLSGFGFGLMNILFKRYFKGRELLGANLWQLGGAILPLGLWALFTEPFGVIQWTPVFIGSVFWIGIIGTAIAFTLWFILLSRYNASSMGVYMFMITVVALVASYILYGERINVVQLAGILVIIVSIYVVNRDDRPSNVDRKPPDRGVSRP